MESLWKRSLSLLLALVMILGMLPMNVLTVHADEVEAGHSLNDAHGLIWLVKSEDGGATEAFTSKVESLLLDDMIRTAIGETDSSKVVAYYYDGAYRDINDMWTFLKYPDMATAMGDEIAEAIKNHQLVTFKVGDQDKKIAFRNILIVQIEVPGLLIEGAGAPDGWEAQVEAALSDPQFSITHIENVPWDLADATLTVERLVEDYEWPKPGDEPLTVGRITVSITADDDESVVMSTVGEIVLHETRRVLSVSYVSKVPGQDSTTVLKNFDVVEFEETPVIEDPELENYTFSGWLKNDAEETGVDATVTDNVTYTAKWTANTDVNGDNIADQDQEFTVTYTDGVEDKVVFANQSYKLAWGADMPTYTPSRTYYTFLGWMENGSEEVVEEMPTEVKKDVVYTAKWEAITDNAPNGGDGIADEEQSFTVTYTDGVADVVVFEDVVHTVAYGKTTPFFTPERTNYTFMGWSPEVSSKVYDNVTYTATWKPNIDVNNNGKADQEETFTVIYRDGKNPDVVHTVAWGEKTPTYSPSHAYYTFNGWTNDVAYLVKQDAIYEGKGWTAKVDNNNNDIADQEETFTIRFFLEEGDTEPYATIQQNGGVVSQLPTQPTKQGFEFVDWQTLDGVAIGSVKVSEDADYYAVWTSGSTVTYVVEYWNDEPTTFKLPATTDGYAQNPGIGDTDDTIWTPWHLEGSTTAFDFATVLSGNITLYCYYAPDANNNNIVDGTADDPYVYYIFKHQNGTEMVNNTTVTDPDTVTYPVSDSDNQVFVAWEENIETLNDGCLVKHIYTPTFADDRNNNEKADGSAEDPYVYYAFMDSTGDSLALIEWLDGDPVVNPAVYESKVTLDAAKHEKFSEWDEEVVDYNGYDLHVYTPVIINDRNDNGVQDGSAEDPYFYYYIKHGEQTLNEKTEYLTGEETPNKELYKEQIISELGEHEKFMGWDDSASNVDENVYIYEAIVIIDRNNNNVHDGTPEDPFTYYLFLDHNGNTVLSENRLAGEDEILPENVVCPVDGSKFEVFVEWDETVVTDADNTVHKTYTAKVIVDENGNGKEDGEEIDTITIPVDNIPGFEAKYENGQFVVSGEKNGEHFEGIIEVTDAQGKPVLKGEDGTFSYTDETVIKASALWSEDGKIGAYVAAIKVNGEEQFVYYKDYTASNKPMDDFALMMAVAPIDEASSNILEIVYVDADLVEKEPHDPIELGKTQYAEDEIYNAVIASPDYDADSVSIMYKAREAGSGSVNLDYFYQRVAALDQNAPEMVKNMLAAVGRPTDSVTVTWDEVWFDIESDVQNTADHQVIADAYIDEAFGENPDIDTLVANAVSIFDGIKTRVNESANIRSFASIAEGEKAVTEQIVINYTDPAGRYFVDYETNVTLKETRLGTTITAPNVTVTYGKFTVADLLAGVTAIDEEGNDVTYKLALDHELYAGYGVGEYQVKVVLPQDKAHKANSATFTLTIKKDKPTITIENIEVKKGEEYDPTPVVDPANAQIVHVIAGIDLEQINIDLLTGVVKYKDIGNMPVKAWIKLPAFYMDVLPKVGIGDDFYTIEGIKQALSEDALGKELVDKLDPALESINSMLDMAEGMVAEKLGVSVDFTLYITFQKDAKPTEPGFYLNYAQIMDTANYEEATAYGTLVITPFIAMPNDGVELVYSDINDTQNLFVLENDGTQKVLKVVHEGKYVDAEVKYYGLTTRGEPSLEAPVDPGVYVATAIYTTEDNGSITMVGSDVALVFVNMTKATIEVDNMSEVYDGTAKYPTITVKDEDGKEIGGGVTVISGSVDQNVEGNGVSLKKMTGNVNIDFPKDLDDAWNSFCNTMNVDVSKTIRPSNVVDFLNWYNGQIDERSATVIDTLTSLQVNAETTQKALDMAKAASNALKEQVAQLPDNVSLSFKNKSELKYTETGAYLFVGVITDPELIPDVNAGLMIIKSADTYEMFDTYVPFDGQAHDITIDDQTSRDGVTVIFDNVKNQVNFILDETMTSVVKKALETAGYTPKTSGNAYAETIYTKGNAAADTLTEAIIAKIEETAVARVKSRYPEASDELTNALAALETRLLNLEDKLSAQLEELDKMDDDTLVYINGQLPVNVGAYKFRGFDYDVAYTGATLYIEPIHIKLDVQDAAKVYGDNDPTFEFDPTYTSRKGVAPNAATEISWHLPAGVKLTDVVNYDITRADGKDVGDYELTLTASLKDTSGNYVLDTTKDTGVFTINPLDVTVSAKVNPETIEVGETAEVSIEVVDANGNPVEVDADFNYDAENLTRNGNVLTAKKQDSYTITPVLNNDNYNVTKTVDATLNVVNIDVIVKAEISDDEVYIPDDNSGVKVTVKVIRDGEEIVVGGIDNNSYIIKNGADEVVDLAAAMKTADTYTIIPDTSKIADGYNVSDTEEVKLVVKNAEITVKVEVTPASVNIPDNTDVKISVKVFRDGEEIVVDGIDNDSYIIKKNDVRYDLSTALKNEGKYTITPNFGEIENGYDVTSTVPAELEVKKTDVNVTLSVSPTEFVVGSVDNVTVNITAADANGNPVTITGLTNESIIVKDSENNVVGLDYALANAGTYTIEVDASAIKNGYNVTANSVTLTVKPIDITVKVEVSKTEIHVGETTTVDVKAYDTDGKEVSVDGLSYKITDAEDNEVDLATALQTIGTYTITPIAEVSGNYRVTNTLDAVTLNVLKPLWDISFANMTLANSLAMNFAFEKGHEDDWTGCYAKIVKTYADGRDDVVATIPADQWVPVTIGGVEHFKITFTAIAAKEMGDDVYVTVYDADGDALSNVWNDSVKAYAERAWDSCVAKAGPDYEEELTMLVDMLNYGAAAQKLFGYDVDHLVNADLTAEQKTYATESVEYENQIVKGENYHAANLSLENSLRFNIAFVNVASDMTAKVTFENHAGRKIDETVELTINGNFGIVNVNQIAVADGRIMVTVTVYNADGSVYGTVTDSMESYIARVSGNEPENAELYEKIMMFSDSVYAFKH